MNEYQTNTKNNTFINIFTIVCIFIVCIIGININEQAIGIEQPKNKLQVGIKTGAIKTGNQNTGSERPITKSTSTMKQGATKNTKKNDSTKQKPLGTNTISGTVVFVKGFPEDSQATKIATYAYKISNGDIDFLATLKAENGGFDMYKQSNCVNSQGKREESYGLCQMMKKYHPEVNTKIFRESREYQVETCYKKYKGGTKFYGFNMRHQYKDDFIIR